VQCFDARNLKKISKRREIANFKVLSNNWISEDIVKIETDVTSSIKVVMELVSDKGKKLSEKIIK
jgi:hypothetical protein